MKKYLKLTLFKKIFLVVFCAFLGVESFSFYLDYKTQLKQTAHNYIGMVDVENIEKICHSLIEKYDYEHFESDFSEEMSNNKSEYQALLNHNGSEILIASMHFYSSEQKKCHIIGEKTEKIYNIEKIGQQLLEKVENYIRSVYKNGSDIPFKILDDGELQYFQIGDIEYNPNHIDSDEIESDIVLNYQTSNFYYSKYYYMGIPVGVDCEELYGRIEDMITKNNIFNNIMSIGNTDIDYYYDDNGELFVFGVYNDVNEEFKFIDVNYTGIDKEYVLKKTFKMNSPVYISAFFVVLVISIMISYMLTRRIKKIEKTTHLIADNQFDLTLKEKPRDELGDLSHSINIMSQKLKHTMEQLNQEIERVKQLESLRKEFINQFTHEMKTPLGIINGYSELLDEAQSDEEKEKYIHLINKETEKINKLIKSMLDLSRLEANKVELQLEDIDLEDIVTEIVDEYEVLLMKKEAKVNVSAFKTHIQADKELIKTVIRNFMSNAVKHVHEKGHINICIDEGVKIYNEGEHIPDENLDTIWYTFVTHDQQGSGLGLAICQSILELHDFEYGVMNKDDGVEFYFKRR